ncbi:MAG: DUF389 domain-containing protein [Polyangiaceae bacterium]|nr:DUF389 domain-containing protein [Polyangiaceae bacterium]
MKLPPALLAAQDRLAALLGCEPSRRGELVTAMLHRGPSEVTGYWMQLLIAAGIATLGLVSGSAAVIIGAMLVAPLMTPIVTLGMGLATGSPLLVVRSSMRVVVSLVVVVLLSAGLVRLLPFHAMNTEIAARTTPTALDLAIAVFCAMAGVFATLRPASDVATTAAGTSIGISLVPPLCVTGFGVGTGAWAVARGAVLLFLTNFAAIVFVGTLAFAAVGFGQVNVHRLETDELESLGPGSMFSRVFARRTSTIRRGLGGAVLRLLMPAMLLAALYTPLRRGLDEVEWQVSARGSVDAAIARLPNRVVQARVHVERREIQVDLFLLGTRADAEAARVRLATEIANASGVTPIVDVFAVTDSTEFEALERSSRPPPLPVATAETAPPSPPPPSTTEVIEEATQRVRTTVKARWPVSAGELLRIDLGAEESEPLALRLTYLGAPLEPATIETLTNIISDELDATVVLELFDLPATSIPLDTLDNALLAGVAVYAERARQSDRLFVCLQHPAHPKFPRNKEAEARWSLLRSILDAHPHMESFEGPRDLLWFALDGCAIPGAQGE